MSLEQLEALAEKSLIHAWANRLDQVEHGPWILYLSLTNLCSGLCIQCPHHHAMRPQRGHMKPEVFQRVLESIPPSVRKVYLMKQGETFLNPHLPQYVRQLKQARPDIQIGLHTNGHVAFPHKLAQVMPHVDHLGFSFWSVRPQTYAKVHGRDHFARSAGHLAEAGRLAAKLGADAPELFVDYVRQVANRDESEQEISDFFRRLCPQLDSVHIHWIYNFHGHIPEGNLQIYDELPGAAFPRCVFPWSSMTVCHDGKVSYCFVEPHENHFLGDVTQDDLLGIWNNQAYRRFRGDVARGDYEAMEARGITCRKCSWLWCMESQTPYNLVGGNSYETGLGSALTPTKKLLMMDAPEILDLGLRAYLSGEAVKASGLLAMAAQKTTNDGLHRLAVRWLAEADKVHAQYANTGLWNQTLAQEGKSLRSLTSNYIKL